VVTKIYELQDGRLEEYPGNYAKYRELRAERRAFQQREYEKQQERIKAEQQYIDKYRAGQRAAQAQGREKRLERFKRDNLLDRPLDDAQMNITLRPIQRCGDLVVTAEHLGKQYDSKTLFHNLSMVIKRGDRVGIIGPNGAGKSTLIRCLLGEQKPDSGSAKVGASVSVGHYHQSHEHLDSKQSVVEYLRRFVASQTEQEARDLAGAFLFSGLDQDKPLGVLSGGERSRAVLAGLVVQDHNVLVLDEPTNHLDIFAAERLEQTLRRFTAPIEGFGQNQQGGGTLLLITHDRMLLENLVDQLLILDGFGGVRHFPGTYSEYVVAQQLQDQQIAAKEKDKAGEKAKTTSKGSTRQEPSPSKKQPLAKQNDGGALAKISQESLEARIVTTESKLADLDRELADPDIYRDGQKVRKLQSQRERLQSELSPLEAEWARRAEN
jgi:ATP-binding cassette subfamily F protein 3